MNVGKELVRKPIFGIIHPTSPWQGMDGLHATERMLGVKFSEVHWFSPHNVSPGDIHLPLTNVVRDGRKGVISINLIDDPILTNWKQVRTTYAESLRQFDQDERPDIRFLPESNLHAYWMDNPAKFVEEFTAFKEAMPEGVKVIFCPNVLVDGSGFWKQTPMDCVHGCDGYAWSEYDTPVNRFNETLSCLSWSPHNQMRLGETAIAGDIPDRLGKMEEWLAYCSIRFSHIAWFNFNKERDWRLDRDTLEARKIGSMFRRYGAVPLYQPRMIASI